MLHNLLDPVILFFIIGLVAGVAKSDVRLPEAIYEILSIYLLLAIGLKGGVDLARTDIAAIVLPTGGSIALGITIPVIAYVILRLLGKMTREDSAAIAAHYGSVSAVTFAVVLAHLDKLSIQYEEFMAVLLVVLEIPAIAIGILIARVKTSSSPIRLGRISREILLGKSIFLIIGGLLVGYIAGPAGVQPIRAVFLDPFKGALAFFLLEMGLVASRRLSDLKQVGAFLFGFGITMPIISAGIGTVVGWFVGLSPGGTAVLATLAGSASYIAAPAAMRIAVPAANPTLYLTASLGITFPFNLVFGIPLYVWMAFLLHDLMP